MRRAFILAAIAALFAWQAPGQTLINNGGAGGSGTVTSITCNGGLSGGAITTTGTCAVVNPSPGTSTANDLLTFSNTTGALQDSGTLIGSLAPLVSPTFTGTVTIGNSVTLGNSGLITWTGRGILSSPAAGSVQLGNANAASPLNQTLLTQGSRGGTDTNVAGANLTIQSGLGTGNATGSTLTLAVPHAGSTGTTAQTATTQIALGDNTVSMPALASSSAAATGTVCWTTGGNLTVDTTLACLSSTLRIKENIVPLVNGLAEIEKLQPVAYDLKPQFNPKGLGRQVGLVAEDVQKVDPRLVGYGGDGKIEGVRYMQLTAVLVQAIKEQQVEIAGLRAQVQRLERR